MFGLDDDDIDDDDDDDDDADGDGGDSDIGRWKLSLTGCKYAITPQAGDYTPGTKQLRRGKFQKISNQPQRSIFF